MATRPTTQFRPRQQAGPSAVSGGHPERLPLSVSVLCGYSIDISFRPTPSRLASVDDPEFIPD